MVENRAKLAEKIHQTAKEKGWWDQERNHDEMFMLVITELSEAVEADREDRYANIEEFETLVSDKYSGGEVPEDQWKALFEAEVKDTMGDELADAYIRCLDYLYYRHREYFTITPIALSISENFAENIFYICKEVTNRRIKDTVFYIEELCEHLGINLEWHVTMKMRYNSLRERKHGGKKY